MGTTFPWAQVPESLHRVLGHAWERIEDNDGFGLGSESEEGLEACTKCLRRDERSRSRTSTLIQHLEDCWKHRWDASSPFLAEFDQRVRQKRVVREEIEEPSPILEAKIKELLLEEWEG